MPDGKLSIAEFAAKIKAKYPTYKDVDDVTLAKKIIEKYPDYASSVDMSGSESVKKKELVSVSAKGVPTPSLFSPSLREGFQSGGIIGESKVQSTLGEIKPPKIDLNFAKDYNKKFEDFTGHKEVELGSELPQIQKQRETNRYLKNRRIEETEIKPFQASIATGTVNPSKIAELYDKPYGKKVVSAELEREVPGASISLEQFKENPKAIEDLSLAINTKNRGAAVESERQYYDNLNKDLDNSVKTLKANFSWVGSQYGGGGSAKVKLPSINTNNPEELTKLIDYVNGTDSLEDEAGNKIDKKEFLKKINQKLFYLGSQKGIDAEVDSLTPQIKNAVTKVRAENDKGEAEATPQFDDIATEQFKLGLSFLKDSKPAVYNNIVRAIKEKGEIADSDFEDLANAGQQYYNQQVFTGGAQDPSMIGKETDIKYTSRQTKKAEYSRLLSEEIADMGYKNRWKIPQEVIFKAAENLNLPNKDIVEDIAANEAAGGYGIVKGGALRSLFRGMAQPIKGIQSSIDAVIDSPAETYLNSKKFDKGDQLIANAKGQYTGELPSEQGNLWYDMVEGFGQFIPQVLLAKGIGTAIEAPALATGQTALTAAQRGAVAAYPGTFISTFAQSYGDAYKDALQKTGSVSKAKLMGTINGISSAAAELFLPDVKIADYTKGLLKGAQANLAKNIVRVVDAGAGKEAATSAAKQFAKDLVQVGIRSGSVVAKETAEELATGVANWITEAVFSPSTIKDRDLANELWDTAKATSVSMIIPAVLGGAGEFAQNKKMTRQGLNYIAINSEEYKPVLDKQLADEIISQADYDLTMGIINAHKQNIKDAPRVDAQGELISGERQLEYAYQGTVAAVNEQKAEATNDPVQKKFFQDKAKQANDIKEKILYGEPVVEGMPKQDVAETIDVEEEEAPLPEVKEEVKVEGEVVPEPLKDVESTAKALEGKDIEELFEKTKNKKYYRGQPTEELPSKDIFISPNEIVGKMYTKGKGILKKLSLKASNLFDIDTKVTKDFNDKLIESWKNSLKEGGIIPKEIKNGDYIGKTYSQTLKETPEFRRALENMGYDGLLNNFSHLKLETPRQEIIVFDKSNVSEINADLISEAYHKAKADGSNPELVKAVEDLLGGEVVPEEKTEHEVKNEQTVETDLLLGGQAAKNRKEGRYTKDGIEYVRNEKGLGEKSDKGGEVRFSNQVALPFTYKIVEAETLQPSHQDGRRNPNHFIPEAQPKNRNDVGSLQAEESFANNPRFNELGENTNAYSGAPIVNERNEVVQGNNRAAGLKKGYARGNESYKQQLLENAEKFGFTKEQVENMKNPVLVREVAASDEGAIQLGNYDVKDLETGGKRRLDATTITRRMPFDVKGRISELLFKGEETVNQAIRSNQKRLLELLNPYLNEAQRNTITKNGVLTDVGIQDLENIVKQFLFDNGDTALPDLYENLSGTQKEGLRKSLPYLFSVPIEKSIVPDVQEAIIAVNRFNESGAGDFQSWLSQGDMFNEGRTPKDIYTPFELEIAKILVESKTQKEISKKFSDYAEIVKDKEADMFEPARAGKNKADGVSEIFKVKYNAKPISERGRTEAIPTKEYAAEPSVEPTKPTVPPTETKAGDALRNFANKVRDGKISKLGGFRAGTGFDQVWDASLEIIAKAIDGGASIADAIEAGLKYAKSTGWYKKLQNQAEFDKKYREHLNTEYNAVQESSTGEVLQRPQEGAGEAGGKRGGVEQGVKGPEVTEEGKAEGKKGEEVVPPVPPTPKKPKEEEGEYKPAGKKKSLLNRLYTAKSIPEDARIGFEKEGLRYQTKSQKEAELVAKGVIDELGIDEALSLADSFEFDGDVNSLIYAESLNRLAEMERNAKTPAEKEALAKKFAEVGIQYGLKSQYGGRFNAAINYFYEKSPLGISLIENAKRKDEFKAFSKGREQSWKEVYDELVKEPEFESIIKEQVSAELKKERAEARKGRIETVAKKIDDLAAKWAKKLSIDNKDDVQKMGVSGIDVFKVAAETAKASYKAGEAVAKVIQDAIDYVSEKIGTTAWGQDDFRKDLAGILGEKKDALDIRKDALRKQIKKLDEQITNKQREVREKKDKETDEEIESLEKERDDKKKQLEEVAPIKDSEAYKKKVLDKLRKRLAGLSKKKQDEVVRRSFAKIIQAGGLEFEDFKKIIADVTGYQELTDEEKVRLQELVKKTNQVEKAAEKVREDRTEESLKKFRAAEFEAGKAARELNQLVWNKPDIVKRLTSIMQLSTLGIPALINNPIYNIWNQATLRFPIGFVNYLVDKGITLAAKVTGTNYQKEYSTIASQQEFFRKLGFGAKESAEQLITGLNRQDYLQKEVYGQQIQPWQAAKDWWANLTGKKKLTTAQAWDKGIQATVGVPAEVIARLLNIGDKPQRFAAEGAQAAAFAKAFGLKGIDYKLFIEFPREEAYANYKKQGLSDAEAAKKADYIKDVIVKEGERATFQQENLLNTALSAVFNSVFGSGKETGLANLVKATTVSPYIKIPTNAFWSYYNLVNPEIALLQSFVHGGRAYSLNKKGEKEQAKLALRESRYWLAHAVTGMAMKAVIIAMVKAGVYNPGPDDESKREREGKSFFESQGTVNVDKLSAFLRGEDPTKVENGLLVQNRWFGQWGTVGNTIARKYEDMTPEQKQNEADFYDFMLGSLPIDALQDLQQGVFANSSSLLTALDGGPGGFSRWGTNVVNMMTNIVHPAAFAQISRAQVPYYTTQKADTFLGELENSLLARSSTLRNLTGKYPPSKVSIWGDQMKKDGGTIQRLFGITKANKDAFARPLYDDAKKYGDPNFFPPAVTSSLDGNELNADQTRRLQEYVGQARKSRVAPYANDNAVIKGYNAKYSDLKTPEQKKKVLEYLYALGRKEGVEKFYQDFPTLKPKEKPVDYLEQIQFDLFKILEEYKEKK